MAQINPEEIKHPVVDEKLTTCKGCGKPLKDVDEDYSGSDHYHWDDKKQAYVLDVPEDRYENPEAHRCGSCGRRLPKKQAEWFTGHKE
jgi:uncharacterized protein with PIN domain